MPFSPGQDSREVVWFSDVSETPWWETLQLSYSGDLNSPQRTDQLWWSSKADEKYCLQVETQTSSCQTKTSRPVRMPAVSSRILRAEFPAFTGSCAPVRQQKHFSSYFLEQNLKKKKKEQFQIDTHRSLGLCQRKPASRSPQAKRGSARTISDPRALVTRQHKAPFLSGSMLI